MLSKHAKDLTGFRSGWLEVIEYIEGSGGKNKHAKWLCYCHRCGNYTTVESGHLTSTWRPILSCGCLKTNPIKTTLEDLTGRQFGFLTVVNLAEKGYKNHHAKWTCLCACGKTKIISSSDLKKGSTISCGCKIMSKGEIAINNVLHAFDINYSFQYILFDLITKQGGNPRIDFAILNNDNEVLAFIEYQGIQHYQEKNSWGIQARTETDPMKKKYCKDRNILLFEIKYDQNPTQETIKILKTLMLIPCQASLEEGVSTIPLRE